ncbi:hypothetical protein H0H81_011494 [Sphagnurus paluster]|uniref:Uncharacterized protein n=1 Tax=Sphagnurus paluster TaxID=117069 RepID=A0A9P7FUJ4_9AGAR|nr:hypothetical protein H0H81_011494 [Sphagnurus paluster]
MLHLPFLSSFSSLHQSLILAFLIVISYFHRYARWGASGLILAFVVYESIVPVTQWAFKIFKWIAMFGFYVNYFQIGVGFIITGVGGVLAFFDQVAAQAKEEKEGARRSRR